MKSNAPPLPPKRGDGALTEILPPFGTNPPTRPLSGASTDLTMRSIHNDPRELWYLALPSKLTPKQIIMVLRSALGGDIWQQWQLLSLMLDTWPMFRKCAHEVCQAVAGTKFIVRPFVDEEGEDPTPKARDKADTVRRALRGMKPNPFNDEKAFAGTVYNLTDMMLNGITMSEVMWWDKGGEMLPRATAWVHPRHFTYSNDGNIAIFDDTYARLYYGSNMQKQVGPDPDKFLCAQFMSKSGSALGAGLMRPLAWYWSSVVFNKDWMLRFAQKYGNPFLEGTYKPGTPDEEVAKLNSFLAEGASQGWISHVEGTEVNIQPAQTLGSDNPQVNLMKQADDACMLLMLGQTATTQGTAGKLGGEDAHENVKREIVQGLANAVAGGPLTQLAGSVVRLNYGDEDECPSVEADFTEATDPVAEAERDQVFLSNKVPMVADEFYARHNLKMPEDGDKVVVGGQLGVMANTDEEIDGVTPPPEPPQFVGQPGQTPGQKGQLNKEMADLGNSSSQKMKKVLAEATDDELEELRSLAVKAQESGEVNGEWQEVKVKLETIASRRGGKRVQLYDD